MKLTNLLGFGLLLFWVNVAVAQDNFTLKGVVKDQQSGELLVGASISIQGSKKGTNSQTDGGFELKNIQQERVSIKVYYLGYKNFTFTHDFLLDPEPELTIYLVPSEMEMDAVEITGKAEGQLRAFLQQKRAINIKNVLSAEQIQSFPDMNAAEAIQRIPGITLQRDQGEGRYVQLRGTPPELSNFNINGEQIPSPEGDVRYVGMDIIAADQIESIEVTKVLTPDMDADGIGGNVNIKTKMASSTKPDIRATFAGGYNNLRQRENYQIQFSFGQRFKKFGFNVNSSYFVNNMGSDNMEYKYAKGPFFGSTSAGVDNYFVQYREFQLRHYDIKRSRLGISPTWDYQFNKNNRIFLRAMYNRFEDYEVRRRKVYDLDDALSEIYYLYGDIEHDVRSRTKTQEVGTVNFGGDHKLGFINIDYLLQYAYASEERPDHFESYFESPGQAITVRFDTSDRQWPRAGYPRDLDSINAFSYGRYDLQELLFEESRVRDDNFAARINLQFPYAFNSSNKGYFKIGGKYRRKVKIRDINTVVYGAYRESSFLYPGEGPELSLETVNDGFYEGNLLGQNYVMEFMPSTDMLQDFFRNYQEFFIIDQSETRIKTLGEDYSALENIYAAYGMFRHDWKKLMVVGGLRFERTVIDYEGRIISTDRGRFQSLDTLSDQRIHDFFLPQVQLRYALDKKTNLRAAVTYSYARPNFEDVLPYREADQDEVKYGNPDLQYPASMNIDVLAERYIRDGIISGGLFYKEIDDFVFYFKRFAHEGDPKDYGLVEITKAINGLEARVFGAELQAQFQFNFLRGKWSNFGLYANYTFTESQAFINQRFPANYTNAVVVFGDDDLSVFSSETEVEEITLPGQARHTANLALLYNGAKLYFRIAANYQDAFLYRLGADKDLDEYYDEALRWDFTMNYKLTPNVKFFIDLINIDNTPLTYYLGRPDRVQQQEFYSWWGRAGFKLKF
ncbi:MAG: TonB-dependent receptor [Bacteroidia bacterium]|nr:TonB-dependent receptor [Bacteroidia bacterium]